MSEEVKLVFEPCRDGRQAMTVTTGTRELFMTMELSSCNPLSELAELLIELYFSCKQYDSGESRQPLFLFWDGDGGQYTWSFTPQTKDTILLEITFFPDNNDAHFTSCPQDELKLSAIVELHSLRLALLEAMKRLLTRRSIIGYRQECDKRDFPIALFLQLAQLDHNRPPRDLSFADDLQQLNSLFPCQQ